jgi:hypothetical protein
MPHLWRSKNLKALPTDSKCILESASPKSSAPEKIILQPFSKLCDSFFFFLMRTSTNARKSREKIFFEVYREGTDVFIELFTKNSRETALEIISRVTIYRDFSLT